ncbi:hypothetical protein [Spirosoma pomorum]|jgi:hypothetical protein
MLYARYVPVILASTLKFLGGPLTGLALGLHWLETAICSALGMMISVVLITYAGTALRTLIARFRPQKPKLFTKRTRLAVRIWKRFGMAGIAFLTPLMLTPIGGTALAVSFGVHRGQLLLYMLLSGIGWAIVQTLVLYQLPLLYSLFKH